MLFLFQTHYNNRRRLSTPSPSPTRERVRDEKNENTHSSWFKSLDRLSRKKTKKVMQTYSVIDMFDLYTIINFYLAV